jgi:hypothetical protein
LQTQQDIGLKRIRGIKSKRVTSNYEWVKKENSQFESLHFLAIQE